MQKRRETPSAATGVRRGCGYRTAGATYLEADTAEEGDGLSIEHFLFDPVRPFDMQQKLGQRLVQGPDERWHVLDWIGKKHYPWPSDFLEEARRMGVSRKISRTLDLSKITYGSRMMLCHERASVAGDEPRCLVARRLSDHEGCKGRYCARHIKSKRPTESGEGDVDYTHFRQPGIGCSAYHWALPAPQEGLVARRNFNGFQYPISALDYDALREEHAREEEESSEDGMDNSDLRAALMERLPLQPALFATLPIGNATVVKARDGSHKEAKEQAENALRNTILPVFEVSS